MPVSVSPDDVFREPWKWRAIRREEACFLCQSAQVVVVSYPGGAASVAEWLTPGSSFYAPHRPYNFRSLSYFLYIVVDEPEPGAPDTEPVISEAEPEDTPAAPMRDENPREEEEEPDLTENTDSVRTAGALTNAARNGAPFCEICERNK